MREAIMETSGTQLREDEVERVTSDTDKLGWDCMLEGRLSKEWLKYAKKNGSPTSPERWTRRLMDKLIQITHQQWICRNHKVHFKTKSGLTLQEHDDLLKRMRDLMYTDPDKLLPQHQHLLLVDKSSLADGRLHKQQAWITRVEAAKLAKQRACGGTDETEDIEMDGSN